MDVCFHVKNATTGNLATSVLLNGSLIPQAPNSLKIGKLRVFEIKLSRRSLSLPGSRLFNVEAKAKKNDNNNSSFPSENGDNETPDSNKSDEPASYKNEDWRDFRAMMYKKYQVQESESDAHEPLYQKWAHSLPFIENGCVLVSTERLDGTGIFERSVILLLRSGNSPFGVIINHPLHKKVKRMRHSKSSNELATTFAGCSLFYGGPLEGTTFLLRVGKAWKLAGFKELIPGIWFGGQDNLGIAAQLVKTGLLKSQDFKFFVGYAAWEPDQLIEEIESGFWYVASCSLDLIFGDTSDSSSESLREDILWEMNGQYGN